LSNAKHQKPASVEVNNHYTYAFGYDSSNNLEYIGKAEIGAATSDSTWQIKKMTYDSSNNLTNIGFAGGIDSFVNVWDDRATYSYS